MPSFKKTGKGKVKGAFIYKKRKSIFVETQDWQYLQGHVI